MVSQYGAWAARWRVPLSFALGVGYLVFAQPNFVSLLLGTAVALIGVSVRALAAGYLEKGKTLATCGPYRYTRNPLYFGSFLMGVGLALAAGSLVLGLALVGFFLLVYWPVMRFEEDWLRVKFGEAYNRYAKQVPLFFPVWPLGRMRWTARACDSKFQWDRYRKNREHRAALGYLAGISFLALKLRLR